MITLENDFLKVSLALKGAELKSLKRKDTDQELIWQADPAYWGRSAPLLFPLVGKLKNNAYTHEGVTYQMSQHGFARDLDFRILQQEKDHCELMLESNEESLQLYPFHFRLKVIYKLRDKTLGCTYSVMNRGNKDMYFSIGAHPGFSCSLKEEGGYYLELARHEELERWLLSDGLFTGEKGSCLNGYILELSEELFEKDAIVWKNFRSPYVDLKSHANKAAIRIHLKEFPYLGIWKKAGADFICIEPWHGLADSQEHNGEFRFKEGIRSLKAGHIFETTYHIEII